MQRLKKDIFPYERLFFLYGTVLATMNSTVKKYLNLNDTKVPLIFL